MITPQIQSQLVKGIRSAILQPNQNERLGLQMQKLAEIMMNFTNTMQKKTIEQQNRRDKNDLVFHNKNQQTYIEDQLRFTQFKFKIQDIRCFNEEERKIHIKIFCSDMTRKIVSQGFKWYEQGKINDQNLRQYFCNNFIANIVKYASQNNLIAQELEIINSHLKHQVLGYLIKRYPKNLATQTNKKFSKSIIPIDNIDSNVNDLIYQSRIQFSYKESGDYSKEIMLFINFLLKLTTKDLKDEKQGKNLGSLSSLFHKDMEEIFQFVQNQQWTILNSVIRRNQRLQDKQNNQSLSQQIQRIQSQKKNPFDHDESETIQQKAKKQKYRKSVKQYTKYLIGQKFSKNQTLYSKSQIQQQNLFVSSPGIMRILTKWCQQLQKCFQKSNIISREQKFRMVDGSERFVKRLHRQELYKYLSQQNQERKNFLKQVMKNIHQNLHRMIKDDKIKNIFRDFSGEDEGIVGYFTTVLKKSYQNYLLSYLNKLIHCILLAQKNFKSKSSLPRIQHYKINVNLISFKIGDLLRCKCSSKQLEIIALYNHLKSFCSKQQNKKILQIIRVKNRLQQQTKDILINFRYRQKIVAEMQLSIKQQISNFLKCSYNMSHFLYELQRATFGPFLELSNIYSLVDSRSEYFIKKFDQHNNRRADQSKVNNRQCYHSSQKRQYTSLPVWCDQCLRFTANLNLFQKHQRCLNCSQVICSACFIENGQDERIKIEPNKLSFNQIISSQSLKIKKKIKILNLNNKSKKQRDVFLVNGNLKILFLQLLDSGKLRLIGEASNSKQFKQFFNDKQITMYYNESDFAQPKKQLTDQIIREITKNKIKKVKNRQRKYFIHQELQMQDGFLQGEQMPTVQKINISCAELNSINSVVNAFPNVKIAFLQKNNLKSIKGVQAWKELKQLNLQRNNLSQIPKQIQQLKNLTFLILSNNFFDVFPQSLCSLKKLEDLNFKENNLCSLPQSISNMTSLKHIRLSSNKFQKFPKQLIQLPEKLEQILLGKNSLLQIPIQLTKLHHLKILQLNDNQLKQIPQFLFKQMNNIQRVNVQNNKVEEIPSSLKNKQKLLSLNFSKNKILKVPSFIFNLPNLAQLQLSNNMIEQLTIQQLNKFSLKRFGIQDNFLKQIPLKLFEINTLQQLKIGGNPLKFSPEQFKQINNLSNLKNLSLKKLGLKLIYQIIFKLPKLQKLNLNDNHISDIPREIGDFKQNMKEFSIRNNKLKQFPAALLDMLALSVLQIDGNQIEYLPQEIQKLKNIQQLKLDKSLKDKIQQNIYQFLNAKLSFISSEQKQKI